MEANAVRRPHRISRLSVISWAIYDLANTVFSTNIVSLYFALFVVNVMHGTDFDFGLADSLSMLALLLTAPVLGAISDQVHRRMPFLIVTSLLCIGFTALLGQGGLMTSLVIFAAANFMYQASLMFYNALLLDVSTSETQGRVGGLGTGLGYLGSFLGVGIGILLLYGSENSAHPHPNAHIHLTETSNQDRNFLRGTLTSGSTTKHPPTATQYAKVFQASALIFLIFAIPCFLFVKERFRERQKIPTHLARQAFTQIFYTLGHAREYPGLLRFLISRIFYIDAVNTVIVFLGLYTTKEIGFTEADFQGIFMVSIIFAVVASFGWGFVVDRYGPKRILNVVLVLWMLIFLSTALIGYLHLSKQLFWPVACLAGVALGGTWSADRPFMLRLSPPRYIGEFSGLYTMAGRFASVIGPFLWGIIVEKLRWGRPAAVLSLLVMVVIGYFLLQKVDDKPREWAPELIE
jgi:UMF1 family MFS transporter